MSLNPNHRREPVPAGGGWGIAPDHLIASATAGQITLSFSRPGISDQKYFVYRATVDRFSASSRIGEGTTATNPSPPQPTPSYTDATTVAGTRYFYWVTLNNFGVETQPSNVAFATAR